MRGQVLANIGVNLKFFRRNRLLFVAGSLLLLITSLSTLPSLFALTSSQHLELITAIANQLSFFAIVLGIGMVVTFVSHHLDKRSIKMVITKPCPPDLWLLSGMLSAVLVTAVLYASILSICSSLFLYWDIPYQSGLVYVLVNDFAQSFVWMGYAALLSVVARPVTTLLALLLLQDSTFYWLKLLLASALKSAEGAYATAVQTAKMTVDVVYLVLPITNPFWEKNETVYKSLRGTDADWTLLLSTVAYAAGVWLFCYLLGSYLLRRRRLI